MAVDTARKGSIEPASSNAGKVGDMARSPVESLEVENLSDSDLRNLIAHARETMERRIRDRLDEYRTLALEAGMTVTLTRIAESGSRRRGTGDAGHKRSEGSDRRGSVEPMYRNPDNHSETWSGRGREPRWLKQKLDEGARKEQFLIRREPEPAPAA